MRNGRVLCANYHYLYTVKSIAEDVRNETNGQTNVKNFPRNESSKFSKKLEMLKFSFFSIFAEIKILRASLFLMKIYNPFTRVFLKVEKET